MKNKEYTFETPEEVYNHFLIRNIDIIIAPMPFYGYVGILPSGFEVIGSLNLIVDRVERHVKMHSKMRLELYLKMSN